MVSKIITSRIIRHQLQTNLQHPKKLRNIRKFCECKKSKEPEQPSCKGQLAQADECRPADDDIGRQSEAFPCDPDCRKGKPNFPPRGCLPWEKGSEICQEASPTKTLQSPTCEHICEPYAGQDVLHNLEMSICELKRFKICLEKTKDAKKCLDLKPKTGLSKKVYPVMHAGSKNNIAGVPVKELSAFVIPKKDNCADQ